jgi:hypothetical protein
MARSTPATIILKGRELVVYIEGTAGGAITPGHLVQIGSDGLMVVHATAGGSSPGGLFALEDDARGKGITDAYDSTTNKNVLVGVCNRGVEIYAILTTSQTVVIGDALESAGNGTLRKHVPQTSVAATSPGVAVRTGTVVARAIEAVTTTGTVARIQVRVA